METEMKRCVVLLRHGVPEANERRLYCGATDIPLSEAGRLELENKRCAGGYPDIRGFKVITSGMLRAEETLFALYGTVKHEREFDLREMDFGAFEMRSYEDLKDEPEYRRWLEGDNEKNVTPGGESGELMCRRVFNCFDRLLQKNERLLLVLHGGPIAALMERSFPSQGKSRYDWQPRGGEGYELIFDGLSPLSWMPVPIHCTAAPR